MPATCYDNDFFYDDHDIDKEHAHYVGDPPTVDLGHGAPASRIYKRRGDWYAVHTH